MTLPVEVLAALTPVVEVLERLGPRYHVGGSLASSAYGVPRATADVDVVAELRQEHVLPFVRDVELGYYVDRDAVQEAIQHRRAFNLVHLESMVKVDIFVPEDRPFDQQELSRARTQTLDIAENARQFFVKSPEDLVLRKLDWYRAGHHVSTQQWRDVVGVLTVQRGRLDRGYLTHWAAELDLTRLLETAMAEADGV